MEKIKIDDIQFSNENINIEKLRDTSEVLVAVVALVPTQEIPEHNANADISVLSIEGEITIIAEGKKNVLNTNELITLKIGTKMQIINESKRNVKIMLIKAPNPGPAKLNN